MFWSNLSSPSTITIFFHFITPFSLYTNNDDNNSSRIPTLNKAFEFLYEICVKKIGTNLGWNPTINNTMVVDSNVMTTYMQSFLKPFGF